MGCLISAMFWLNRISQILISSKTLQHFDVLGMCIPISVHAITRRVRYRTYRRGLGVACSEEKAMREPR